MWFWFASSGLALLQTTSGVEENNDKEKCADLLLLVQSVLRPVAKFAEPSVMEPSVLMTEQSQRPGKHSLSSEGLSDEKEVHGYLSYIVVEKSNPA